MTVVYYADILDYQEEVVETVEADSQEAVRYLVLEYADWHPDAMYFDLYRQNPAEGSILLGRRAI